MHIARLSVLLLVLFALAGCASVSMVASRKDPAATSKKYQSFLVVGISENSQRRQVFEEIMAVELRKKGLSATPSYSVTGFAAKLSRDLVVKAVQATAVDAVITTRIADTKRATTKDVGYEMTDRGVDGYAGWYGAGTVSYATFDLKPVEITTSTTFALESQLFDTATQNMVWTGITNAVDPQGIITATEKFAGVVIKTLAREGLIK